MEKLILILSDGLLYASVLLLVAIGLTFILGILRILNVAHGSLYAFGAYMGVFLVSLLIKAGHISPLMYLGLLSAAVAVGWTLGPILERVFLRRVYEREVEIQLLVTYAIFLMLEDVMKLSFGVWPYMVTEPYIYLGVFTIAGVKYTGYQLALLGVAIITVLSLWAFVRWTRFGKIMIAVAKDRETSKAIGVNVNKVFIIAFSVGATFAALGGALISPAISVVPGIGIETIVLAFAVVAIGGFGSFAGAALGVLMVGLGRAAAIHLFPEVELVVIYLVMVLVLLARHRGLFGEVVIKRL